MNQADLPCELEHLSKPTPNFKYGIKDAETQMVVQQRTNEVRTLMRRTSQDIIAIGQKLSEVKQHLGHGNFINWLKSEFNWSVSTATTFIQLGEQFKFVNFTNLNITASGLYLTADHYTPKEARTEVLGGASIGKNISYTKTKAIGCVAKTEEGGKVGVLFPCPLTLHDQIQPIQVATQSSAQIILRCVRW